MLVKKGSTNVEVELYIVDSGDGTPELGVLWNTAGIDLNYRRKGAVVTSITEATLSALTDAHSDGGFLEVGNGRYRLDVPDAAFASGVDQVTIGGTVTGMVVLPVTVQLVDFDPADATRLGLTALPNAAPDTNGGLPTEDASGHIAADVREWLGTAVTTSSTTAKPQVDVDSIDDDATAADNAEAFFDGTGYAGTGNTIPTVTTLTGHSPQTGDTFSQLPTNFSALSIDGGGLVQLALPDSRIVRNATAQAGAAGSITLDASASSVDDFYNDTQVYLYGGTGIGQVRVISDYNGTTKVATVDENWATAPDNTTSFAVIASHVHTITSIQNGLATETKQDTAQADLDLITGSDGVTLATSQGNYAPSKAGDSMALTTAERDAVSDALLDLVNGIESGITPRQALRAMTAILAGIISGAGTGTEVFKGIGQASGGTTRVTVTVDASGNRSAMTLNL